MQVNYHLHAAVSYTKAYTDWYTVGRQAEKLYRHFLGTSGMCCSRLSLFDSNGKNVLSYEVDEWSYWQICNCHREVFCSTRKIFEIYLEYPVF